MNTFTALWLHRFRKSIHIAQVLLSFGKHWATIFWLKTIVHPRKTFIGIFFAEHFGDIVAAEPIVRQLKATYPNSYLVWMVRPDFAILVNHNPLIDKVVHRFCAREVRWLIASKVFDISHNLQFESNNFCKICYAYVKNEAADKQGVTIHNFFTKKNLLTVHQTITGLPREDFTPQLYIPEAIKNQVQKMALPPKFVVIHCQSNKDIKDWSMHKWEAFVAWFTQQYPDIWVVEVGLKSQLKIENNHYLNLCGQLNLLETAEVIRLANLFVGLDSGPAHFANAVGTEGIILMGKIIDYHQFMPFSGHYQDGTKATIIRAKTGYCDEILLEELQEVVEKTMTKYWRIL